MNKQELTLAYVKIISEKMSTDALVSFFIGKMYQDMQEWTMGELLDDIKEYAPELLEEEDE